jgi:hypothetical protein
MSKPETGAASLHISLSEGVIEVSHGVDCTLLGSGTAKKGDWQRLIDFLRKDLKIEWRVQD